MLCGCRACAIGGCNRLLLIWNGTLADREAGAARAKTYWKPMCEWTNIAETNMASMVGFKLPAANGARVRGIRATESARSAIQW